jgi:hypothetical protein
MSPSPPSIRWANSPVTVPQVKAYSLIVIWGASSRYPKLTAVPPLRITTRNRCCKGGSTSGLRICRVGSARVFGR